MDNKDDIKKELEELEEKFKQEKEKLEKEEEKLKKEEEELKKEFENLIESLKKEGQKDGPKVKVVSIRVSNQVLKNPYLDALFILALNLFFVLALAGIYKFFNFNWIEFSHYAYIFLFVLIFSFSELILKLMVFKYLFKLVLMSFGVILILTSIMAFILALIVTPELSVTSEMGIITYLILFLVARSSIKSMITSNKFHNKS
ncbi:MAG: hypothetical protein ACOX4W_03435 [Bacilli bacterium]|jgi:hypothetical protein